MRSVAGNYLKLFIKALISDARRDAPRRQRAGTLAKRAPRPIKIRLETSIFTVFVNSLTMKIAARQSFRCVESPGRSAHRSAGKTALEQRTRSRSPQAKRALKLPGA
jgi:hypothetical protein